MSKTKQAASYKIKYIGNTPETAVNGLGIFQKDRAVTFKDQDQINAAKALVKNNVNFEEVDR